MRLIDADALPVCKEHCIDECGFGANFYVVHKTDIDAAPTITIEAEPVKHGRWIDRAKSVKGLWDYRFDCSTCGHIFWNAGIKNFNYCPNCGAKMDLEET